MIGRQLSFTALAFLTNFVLNLVKVKYLSNVLTTEDYGLYTLFFNTVSFASLVVILGLDRFLTSRAAVTEEREALRTLSSVGVFYLIAFCLVFPLVMLAPGPLFYKLGISAGLFLFGLGSILRFYLLARKRVATYSLLNLLTLQLWLPLVAVAAPFFGVSLPIILGAMNAGFAITCLMAGWMIWRRIGNLPVLEGPRLTDIKEGFAFALPLLPMVFSSKLLQIGDRYFLLAFGGSEAVAFYSMVGSLLVIIVSLLTILSDTLRPYILADGNTMECKRMINNAITLQLLVVGAAAVGACCFGREAIALVSSESYAAAAALLPWLIPVLVAQVFVDPSTNLLESMGKTKVEGIGYGVAASVYLAANMVLDPFLKSFGCAISYSLAMVVLALSLVWSSGLYRQLASLPWLRLAASTSLLSVCGLAVRQSHFYSGLVGMVIFSMLSFAVIAISGRPFLVDLVDRKRGGLMSAGEVA